MTISALSTTPQSGYVPYQAPTPQQNKALDQLAQALQASDLTGAQQAFAALTQTAPSTPAQSAPPQSAQAQASNPLTKDLAALSQALQAGDVKGAQTAFAKLQDDLKALGAAKGGHHHHHAKAADADGGSGGSGSSKTVVSETTTPGSDGSTTTTTTYSDGTTSTATTPAPTPPAAPVTGKPALDPSNAAQTLTLLSIQEQQS